MPRTHVSEGGRLGTTVLLRIDSPAGFSASLLPLVRIRRTRESGAIPHLNQDSPQSWLMVKDEYCFITIRGVWRQSTPGLRFHSSFDRHTFPHPRRTPQVARRLRQSRKRGKVTSSRTNKTPAAPDSCALLVKLNSTVASSHCSRLPLSRHGAVKIDCRLGWSARE